MKKLVAFNSPVEEKLNSADTTLSPLLSIEDLCAYLGLGKTIVYEMISKGEIPHIRVRSRIRVTAADLLEYLNKNREGG